MNRLFSVIKHSVIGIALSLLFASFSHAVVQFNIASDTVDEGWGAYTFTVVRDNAGGGAAVDYTISGSALAGADYTGQTSGTLVWETSDGADKTFTLNIIDDQLIEASENIVVTLSNATAGETIGVGITSVTVLDNEDPLQFSAANYSVDESAGTVLITVERPAGLSTPVSVNYTTVPGTAVAGSDYTSSTGTVSWGGEDTAPSKSFSITITDDMTAEIDEKFSVVLSNPSGGSILGAASTAVITINNDDSPIGIDNALNDALSLTSDSFSLAETAGSITIDVKRSGTGDGFASIDYSTADGTAIADDYVPKKGTLTWADGEVGIRQITLVINEDSLVEGAEFFKLVLSNLVGRVSFGAITEAKITIGDQSKNIAEVSNLSDNQKGTAGVIDSECTSLAAGYPSGSDEEDFKALCDSLRDGNTTDDQVRQALDAINPEELTKMGAVSRQVGGLQHQNIESRFNVIHRGGGGGIDLSGFNLDIDGQQIQGVAIASMLDGFLGGASGDDFSRWGLFANGNLKFGDKDASDTNAGYDFEMFGLTVGADYRFTDDFVLGASIGYGVADIDYGNNAGGMDTASWSGTVYSSYYVTQDWYVDGLINYAQDNYDSTRRIVYTDAGGTVDRTAVGDTGGNQLSFGINTGYDFHAGAWVFGPHFSSYYLNVEIDKLEEYGAAAWNTVVSDNQSQSFTMSGGGHVSYVFTPSWGVIIPYARIDLVHEFYDDPEVLQMRFAVSSELIEISTNRLESDYANIGVGITAQFKHGLSGFVDYQTTAGYSGFSIHDVSFGMRLERSF